MVSSLFPQDYLSLYWGHFGRHIWVHGPVIYRVEARDVANILRCPRWARRKGSSPPRLLTGRGAGAARGW